MQRITVTTDDIDLGYSVVHVDFTGQLELVLPPGWVDSAGLLYDLANVAIVVLDPTVWEARHESTTDPIGEGWIVLERCEGSSIQLRRAAPAAAAEPSAAAPLVVCASAGPDERPARPGETCSCGRPARSVLINDRGEVGYCGLPAGAARGAYMTSPAVSGGTDLPGDLSSGYTVVDADPASGMTYTLPAGWRHTAALALGEGEGITWVVADPARWEARWAPAGHPDADGWVTVTAGAAAVIQVRPAAGEADGDAWLPGIIDYAQGEDGDLRAEVARGWAVYPDDAQGEDGR